MTRPQESNPGSVRRLAVPVLAGGGNALLAQPLVRQLAGAFPGAAVRIFARNAAIAAPFQRLAEVEAVEVYSNAPAQFFRLLRRMRSWRADLCVIPYPSNRWQYSLLAATCGARRVVMHGYAVGYWRAAHFLAGERVMAREGVHDVVQNLRLLEPLGIDPDGSMAPVFPLEPEEIEQARDRLPPGDAVAIHAGSGRTVFGKAKRWEPAHYRQLADQMASELDIRPVLIEGPDEAGVSREIDPEGRFPVIRFNGPLAEAAAILAACRLYVGNDSGLAHLAAAVGTPPVTLFGPARPDELCPFGYRHLVVQTSAPCAPCFRYPTRAVTPHVACRPPYCVNLIQVRDVMPKIRLALDQSAKTAASSRAPVVVPAPGAAG